VSRRARSFEADKAILPKIEELKREHPAWGYRRVWAWLRRREGLKINHKRVMRVMKANSLDVRPARSLKAPREAKTHKMRSREPNSLWGTDMTKVMIPSEGWAYLHVVLDWASKKLVGWSLSRTSKASDWLAALDSAVAGQFPHGIKETKPDGLYLVSDHGSQPTSKAYMEAAKALGFCQVFSSYCNPKGNADTERVIRTIKEDLVWPRDWSSFGELEGALGKWIAEYNALYPHSALGYDTPVEYEQWFIAAASSQ
jgi:transposase InsO family protein